jgi:hypothetical protein
MKRHDLVKVFSKPITDEGLEGYARLLTHLDDSEIGERWTVQFIGPRGLPEAGMFERWVNERNVVRRDTVEAT